MRLHIDCPPSLSIVVINALVAADSVLIPVQAHYHCYEALGSMLDRIKSVRAKLNPNLKIAGILLTLYQGRTTLCREIAHMVKENYGTMIKVFDTMIPYSIKGAEQPVYEKSVLEFAPKSPVAISYQALAKELMDCG